jgi:hypothetical protein
VANVLYPKFKEALLKADVDLENDTIKAVLYDTNDVAYSAAHEFLSSVSAAVVGTAVALTGKTFTNGTFDANDVTLTSVTGDQSEAVLIYQDTGVAGTSRLIGLYDTATGLPVTPGGGNVLITWNASGIFSL